MESFIKPPRTQILNVVKTCDNGRDTCTLTSDINMDTSLALISLVAGTTSMMLQTHSMCQLTDMTVNLLSFGALFTTRSSTNLTNHGWQTCSV